MYRRPANERLRIARITRRLSQDALGAAVGMSQTFIWRLETGYGHAVVTPKIGRVLSTALGVPEAELFPRGESR